MLRAFAFGWIQRSVPSLSSGTKKNDDETAKKF